MPLHLLLGLRTSLTPSFALHRRRTSPGMSLKYRHCSFGFQIGPSVNQKPVQSFSTVASLSISLRSSGDFASTAWIESLIPISRLLNVQAYPAAGPLSTCSAKFAISNLTLRKTICLALSSVKPGSPRLQLARDALWRRRLAGIFTKCEDRKNRLPLSHRNKRGAG